MDASGELVNSAMSKIWQITRRLLYQNRWIYLFLMLWPFGMAAILLVPAAKPETDDVLSILHQECLYGLGLVAFTGSALLGNEQRSRRIATVLSRAVSRRQYFFALGQRSVAAAGALCSQFCGEWNRSCLRPSIDRRHCYSRWPWHNLCWECGQRPRPSSLPPGCP